MLHSPRRTAQAPGPTWLRVLLPLCVLVPAVLTIRWTAGGSAQPESRPAAVAPAPAVRPLRPDPGSEREPPRTASVAPSIPQGTPAAAAEPRAAAEAPAAAPPTTACGEIDAPTASGVFLVGFDGGTARFGAQRLRCLEVPAGVIERLLADSQQMERERDRDPRSQGANALRWRGTPEQLAFTQGLWAAYRRDTGEADYDLLRFASGQSNRAQVRQILPGSPAEQAGFRVGDAVRSYDGQRVFAARELVDAARSRTGERGSIRVEVEREGHTQVLYVPSGLMGLQITDQCLAPPQ